MTALRSWPCVVIRPAARRVLGAQLLAALGAAARENLTAILGRHAGAETVKAFAHKAAGLISPFHGTLTRKGARVPCGRGVEGRCISKRPGQVNARWRKFTLMGRVQGRFVPKFQPCRGGERRHQLDGGLAAVALEGIEPGA